MKKLGILLLALMMLFLLVPLGASAAAPDTVRVGNVVLSDGQYVASNGSTAVTAMPNASTGYAHYSGGVLTLHHFDYDQTLQAGYTSLIHAEGDLKIVCSDISEMALYVAEGCTSMTAGIHVTGNLQITSAYADLTIANNSKTESGNYGIYVGEDLDIQTDGYLYAYAGDNEAGSSVGIRASGEITVSGMGGVFAYGRASKVYRTGYSAGVVCENITISSDMFGAYGGTSYGSSQGISAGNTICISGDQYASVGVTGGQATQASTGMTADNRIQIDGGRVTARGGVGGINSRGIGLESSCDLVVNGGEVLVKADQSNGRGSYNCAFEGYSIVLNDGTLTLDAGKVTNGTALYYVSGFAEKVTVNGGTFIAKSGKYALKNVPQTANYDDCAVWVSTDYSGSSATVYDDADALTDYKYVKIGKAEYVEIKTAVSNVRHGKTEGSGKYVKGSSVTVRATPLNESTFTGWTKNSTAGATVSTSPEYTFTAAESMRLYANFAPKLYKLTVTNGYMYTVNGKVTSLSSEADDSVIINANDLTASGLLFDKWVATGITLTAEQENSEELWITMPRNAVTLRATYKEINDHTHAPCGDASCSDSSHPSHGAANYSPWDGSSALSLKSGSNYYYLTRDVSTRSAITVTSGQTLYLCLHGNDLEGAFSYSSYSVFNVYGTGKLYLCDCKGSTGSWGRVMTCGAARGIKASDNAVVEIYGGNITDNYFDGYESGGGIYIEDDALVTMYDGAITNNKVGTYMYGGGVCVYSGAEFVMHGGVISGNKAVDGGGIYSNSVNTSGAHVTITGGTVTGNTATRNGGGVYIFRNNLSSSVTDFVLSGGRIINDISQDLAAGVYLDHAKMKMSGGAISGNTAARAVGGINNYCGILEMSGGTVTDNKGGGVYYSTSAGYGDSIIVSGDATVTDNTGYNVYLESGSVMKVAGALMDQINVTTQDIPAKNAPVRYLKPAGHTITQSDLNHTASDRSGEYYIKNIDGENYGIFGKVQYKVTVTSDGSGAASADIGLAEAGTVITLSNTPDEGYRFKAWEIISGGVTVADNAFTMGNADAEIKATFELIHVCGSGTPVTGQSATCTADGWKDYYECSCSKLYADVDCTDEITDLAAWKIGEGRIPASHTYGDLIPAAEETHTQTELKPGVAAHYICGACGKCFTEAKEETTLDALTGETPEHTYGAFINTDVDKHWKECSCGLKSEEGEHVFDDEMDATCDTCGYERTVHQHTFSEEWTYDEKNHWHASTCGHDVTSGLAGHNGGTASCTAQAVCEDCGQPYGELAEHNYGDLIPAEEENHTQTELKPGVAAHYICGACGKYFTEAKEETTLDALTGETPEHTYGAFINTDVDKHWKECSCGLKSEEGEHVFDDEMDATCDTCGYTRTVAGGFFTVTFHANGGQGMMDAQSFMPGTAQKLTANAFRQVGYIFMGWNTAADGSGTWYADGQTVMIDADIHLYAQWKLVYVPVDPMPEFTPAPTPEPAPLMIIRHPEDQSAATGMPAEFSVLAAGEGLTYQWYIDRNDGRGWVILPGMTSPVCLTPGMDAAFDGYRYACEVRDIHGQVVRSNAAVLYLAVEPDVPATGDHADVGLLCAMLMISFAGCFLLSNAKRRQSAR